MALTTALAILEPLIKTTSMKTTEEWEPEGRISLVEDTATAMNISRTQKTGKTGGETPPPPRKIQPKIINVSPLSLTKHHLKLFSHGSKFAPVTKGTYIDAKKALKILQED